MLNCRFIHLFIVAATFAFASLAHAQTFYFIGKEQYFRQNSSATPTLVATGGARFGVALPSNTAGSVRLPSGITTAIPANSEVDQRFSTVAALDAAYPAGIYTLTVGSVSGIAMTIPANPYPSDIPRVVGGTWNTAGELVVDPTKDYTLTINTYTGYGTVGVVSNIRASFFDGVAGQPFLERQEFSNAVGPFVDSISPTPFTTVTIPAGRLVAGRGYGGELQFLSIPSTNTTGVPGSVGFVGGFYVLNFGIAAVVPANAGPTIARQPTAQTIETGSTVVFSVEVNATPAPTYQWRRGTTAIAGETRPTLFLTGAAASAGNYNCVVTNSQGSVTSADAVLTVNNVAATAAGRLDNLSVLALTGTGAQLLTMGANVGGGTGPLPLVVRGIGPTLGTFRVPGTLADPTIAIFPENSDTPSATNDNWGGTPALTAAFAAVGGFELPPTSLDAAALHNQSAGGFTVQVAGKGGATGTVIAEVYDAAGAARTATTPRLVNLSTLTSIGTAGSLTAGFVVGGTTARTVLVRAVGPTLATAFGIGGALEDPRLEVFTETGAKLGENDNWGGAPALASAINATGAFALGSAATKDAALVITLAPGNYSARASGLNGISGTTIVEVYEVR